MRSFPAYAALTPTISAETVCALSLCDLLYDTEQQRTLRPQYHKPFLRVTSLHSWRDSESKTVLSKVFVDVSSNQPKSQMGPCNPILRDVQGARNWREITHIQYDSPFLKIWGFSLSPVCTPQSSKDSIFPLICIIPFSQALMFIY